MNSRLSINRMLLCAGARGYLAALKTPGQMSEFGAGLAKTGQIRCCNSRHASLQAPNSGQNTQTHSIDVTTQSLVCNQHSKLFTPRDFELHLASLPPASICRIHALCGRSTLSNMKLIAAALAASGALVMLPAVHPTARLRITAVRRLRAPVVCSDANRACGRNLQYDGSSD